MSIKVLQCYLYPELPEEMISESGIDFIETSVKDRVSFLLKQVSEGQDPAVVRDSIYAGYYDYYGVAYLAYQGGKRWRIAIDVENKRLILDVNDFPFYEDRDAYVYTYRHAHYTRQWLQELFQEFQKNGYTVHHFKKSLKTDMMMWYPDASDIPLGEALWFDQL